MEEKFESLVQSILDHNYAVMDGFFEKQTTDGLRHNLLERQANGLLRQAGVGKQASFQRNVAVRNDVVSWLETDSTDPHERRFLDTVAAFYQYLNRTCYTGINGFECHYALYATGSFYKRHLDQFQSDRGRRFSMVAYLNDNWAPSDGGELVLYLPSGTVTLLPEAGRAVFFKADEIEHEVLPANRDRMSIAGWLLSL